MPSIPHFRAFRLRTDGQVNNAEPKLDTAGADRMPVQNRKAAGRKEEATNCQEFKFEPIRCWTNRVACKGAKCRQSGSRPASGDISSQRRMGKLQSKKKNAKFF